MVCSGINYAAMLADMVQGEDGYRRNEIVEMVTGGDTRDEFVLTSFLLLDYFCRIEIVEYHAGSSSSSLQNTSSNFHFHTKFSPLLQRAIYLMIFSNDFENN